MEYENSIAQVVFDLKTVFKNFFAAFVILT